MEDSTEALRRAGVVTLHADASRAWQAEAGKICEVVRSHQGSRTDYRLVLPLAAGQSHAALRNDLIGAAPRLGELVQTVRAQLAGNCAVLIPHLGLAAFDDNQRALLAYALAACLGNPTATDTKRVIWDVKARSRDSSYFSTFSETDLEAAFHSDTQYYPAPEQLFLLYCMQPARCGGGLSSICDARALRRDIEATERWIADVLASRLLPFRVPSAFVTTREPDAVQATLAPVFADDPLIRYRRDTLSQGLLHFPECADADAHRALDAFDERLADCPHTAEFFMPRDSLVVVDNHRALHARTSFQDDERHMLRIRVRTQDPARPEALPRIVTRSRRAAP